MNTEDSGQIKGTAGSEPVHAFACRDKPPCPAEFPPLTNGGMIRMMDNHQLAKLAVRLANSKPLTETQYFDLLCQPSAACMARAVALENESG